MAKSPIPLTQERLKQLLDYNPETGVFTWAVRRGNALNIGSTAGSLDRNGYLQIETGNKLYLSHRLAWFYMTGVWPALQVDHINRNKSDNRWANLRLATHGQNHSNSVRPSNNTTGFKGVGKKGGKWYAQIVFNKKHKHLGTFSTPEAAHAAYCAAAHEVFGEFARTE